MKIEVSPKKYRIVFGWDQNQTCDFDECDNSLSLSEEQFKTLLFQICNIAEDEGLLDSVIEVVKDIPSDQVRHKRTVIPFIG